MDDLIFRLLDPDEWENAIQGLKECNPSDLPKAEENIRIYLLEPLEHNVQREWEQPIRQHNPMTEAGLELITALEDLLENLATPFFTEYLGILEKKYRDFVGNITWDSIKKASDHRKTQKKIASNPRGGNIIRGMIEQLIRQNAPGTKPVDLWPMLYSPLDQYLGPVYETGSQKRPRTLKYRYTMDNGDEKNPFIWPFFEHNKSNSKKSFRIAWLI
jgi:hypothetical protein